MIKVETPSETCYYPRGAKYWFCESKKNNVKIFLAGTIDNGNSGNWQEKVISDLCLCNLKPDDDSDLGEDFSFGDIIIFNPRRDDWNSDFGTEEVEKQIRWEQNKLDEADIIVMYFDDNSKSPISLLELGLYGPHGKMIVFCTDKFYRFSNIKLTCEKFLIPLIQTTDISEVSKEIEKIYKELSEYNS